MESKTKKGDVYHSLTVIEEPFITTHLKFNRFNAKVKCNCGNEFIARCSNLRTNRTKTCSDCAWKKRSHTKSIQVNQNQQMFRRLVLDRCRKHDIEISITVDDYSRLITQNCFYCNDKPRKTNRFSNRKYVNTETVFANGVDRIDSSKGYTLENCITCCTSCNYAKHKLTQSEFFDKIVKIYKNLNLK
jgi:predicted RNA-binding Zn-ribbon protein involved in translation (DUF1610 family)